MTYYARKVNQSKWNAQLKAANGNIRGLGLDLFARDLKADKRDISLWRMDTSQQEPDIKLVLGLFGQKISTFQYLLIPEKALAGFEIESSESDARTAVTSMVSQHYNIVHVNLAKFEDFLSVIKQIFQSQPAQCKRVTEAELRSLVDTAFAKGRIDVAKLDVDLRISLFKDHKIEHKPPIVRCPDDFSHCRLCSFSAQCSESLIERIS